MSGPPYTPPVRDIRFGLEVAGLGEVLALPAFAGIAPETVADIIDQAARFAAEVLAPTNRAGDTAGARLANGAVTTAPGFREAYAAFQQAGWCAAGAEASHGGLGLPRLVATALWEM